MGSNLPVLIDVNIIPTGATLADGRLLYSTAVNATTRVNPAFDHINVFKSIGESSYNAFTLTLARRMRGGWQAQATYTLARGTDNAPLTGTYVVGSGDDRVSDPTNLDREKGVTPFNQTHTLVVSGVLAPQVAGDGMRATLLNNNQLGFIFQANSGLPFNIRSNLDLNADGVSNDRPLYMGRNEGRLGNVVNLDMRYSRFIPFASDPRGAVRRSQEPLQPQERRERQSRRHDRCQRRAAGADSRSIPRQWRLRPAHHPGRLQVDVLTGAGGAGRAGGAGG